jgi:hypothetical protein
MPNTSNAESDQRISISEESADQSQPFIGQWNQLISTTNWEKGEIICNWRNSLESSDAAATEYSDEAWSQLVGGVTPQHVGRLRRTSERFGHVFGEYQGIYWSHFYASLDWDDAEMWLEGAVQNKWSVAKMRQHRWETLGKIPGQEPDEKEIVATELGEETQSLDLAETKRQYDRDYIEGPVHEGPDFGDERSPNKDRGSASESNEVATTSKTNIRPFESFQDLPEDVMEASGAFKLAIIRHKSDEWKDISQADMIGVLDALKQLAQIPAE